MIKLSAVITNAFLAYLPTFEAQIKNGVTKKKACMDWFKHCSDTLKSQYGDIRNEKFLQDVIPLYTSIPRETVAPYFNGDWKRQEGLIDTVKKAKTDSNALPAFEAKVFTPALPDAAMMDFMGADGKKRYLADLEAKNNEAREIHQASEAQRLLETYKPYVIQTVASLKTVLNLEQIKTLFDAAFVSLEAKPVETDADADDALESVETDADTDLQKPF